MYNFESSVVNKLKKTKQKKDIEVEMNDYYSGLAIDIANAQSLSSEDLFGAMAAMYYPKAIETVKSSNPLLQVLVNNQVGMQKDDIREEINDRVYNLQIIKQILEQFEDNVFDSIYKEIGMDETDGETVSKDKYIYFNILTGRLKINTEEKGKINKFFDTQISLNKEAVGKALKRYQNFFFAIISIGNIMRNKYVSKMNEKWKTSIQLGCFDSFSYPWEVKEGFDFEQDWDEIMKNISLTDWHGGFIFKLNNDEDFELSFIVGGEEGVKSNIDQFLPKFTNYIS